MKQWQYANVVDLASWRFFVMIEIRVCNKANHALEIFETWVIDYTIEEKSKDEKRGEEREGSGKDHDEGRTVSSDTLGQWQAQVKGRRVSSTYTTSTYAASTNTC